MEECDTVIYMYQSVHHVECDTVIYV